MSILDDQELVLQCPECKHHGLVRLKHSDSDEFECVYCHKRQLLNHSNPVKEGANVLAILLALFTSLLILLPMMAL